MTPALLISTTSQTRLAVGASSLYRTVPLRRWLWTAEMGMHSRWVSWISLLQVYNSQHGVGIVAQWGKPLFGAHIPCQSAWVQILPLVLFQLLMTCLGSIGNDSAVWVFPATHGGIQVSSWFFISTWPSPTYCRHLKSEQASGKHPSLCRSDFHTNTNKPLST